MKQARPEGNAADIPLDPAPGTAPIRTAVSQQRGEFVSSSAQFLNPSEAAKRLGVSVKALRLYEQRGLITPIRTAAGWRAYGPDEMARAAEIAALRALGLSLAQVARVLQGDAAGSGAGPGRAPGHARRPDPPARRHGGEGPRPAARPRPGQGADRRELARLAGAGRRPAASPSICPGPGAANGSSCATSGR